MLDVPLEKCVPCLLHAVMNLTRLLWNRLISEAIENDAYGLPIIDIVESKLKLKVPASKKNGSESDSKKSKNEGSDSYQRLSRARFVYSEWTKLLKNHHHLAMALTEAKSDLTEEVVSCAGIKSLLIFTLS